MISPNAMHLRGFQTWTVDNFAAVPDIDRYLQGCKSSKAWFVEMLDLRLEKDTATLVLADTDRERRS